MTLAVYQIVGMKYRGTEKVLAQMKKGEPLRLVRDPFNTHDRNAVEVWGGGVHLGFVKGSEVAPLAGYMDRRGGGDLDARLSHDGHWPAAEVDV